MRITAVDGLVMLFMGEGHFSGLGISDMKNSYEWGGLDYTDTRSNAKKWSSDWKSALGSKTESANMVELKRIARDILQWGGISSYDNDERNEKFISNILRKERPVSFDGIASYSKILPVSDPERYAIFDSRVAMSLNYAQVLAGVDMICAFPQPSIRSKENSNRHIALFSLIRGEASEFFGAGAARNFAIVKKQHAYRSYLFLLRCASRRLKAAKITHDLADLEMTLFSQVTKLACRLRRQNASLG